VNDVLTIGLFVGLAALVAYQVYMLAWTKKTAGEVPTMLKVLRWVNIVLLVAATALVTYILTRG